MDIKPDPEYDTPEAFPADEDAYEDDVGELHFPKEDIQKPWLVRIPPWLWESLQDVEDDEEVEIGKFYQIQKKNGEQEHRIVFNGGRTPKLKDVPKQYQVNITNQKPTNTYLFSEKDTEGYHRGAYRKRQQAQDSWKVSKQNQKKRYSRAIPKQTALVAAAQHEVSCIPVENAEYETFMARRAFKANHGEYQKTNMENSVHTMTQTILNGKKTNFSNFIKTGPPKPSSQINKAARIDQAALLDQLFNGFKQYKYWNLKALKAATQQPEAYLKETLQQIATMVRTGPFTNTWTLNEEYNDAKYQHVKDEAAPELDGGSELDDGPDDVGDLKDEDDDDDDEMEDVKLS